MKKPDFSLPERKWKQAFLLTCFASISYSSLCLADSPANKHIEIIAASCAACHGTNGKGVDNVAPLAGMSADEISEKLIAFKTGKRASKVMHHHAKGLTDQEIHDVSHYFSQQAPAPIQLPPKPNTP